MDIHKSCIYQIKNIITNKIYIGSAINGYNRFHVHKSHLNSNKHHSKYLQRAWNKYGVDAFEFSIIEYVLNKEKLTEREQYWIDALKPEYNIAKIAGSSLGIKRSEATKIKQSLLKLGKSAGMLGLFHSKETKEKIRIKRLGTIQSEETKLKKSNSLIGNINASGKRSEEIKLKQRKLDKWPHELGIKCKCRECLDKLASYHRDYRKLKNAK